MGVNVILTIFLDRAFAKTIALPPPFPQKELVINAARMESSVRERKFCTSQPIHSAIL